MQPSARLQAVQAPIIAAVGELVRDHPGTLSLGQGVVSYPPPPQALARLTDALAAPATHGYAHVAGLPALVERIEAKLRAENGLSVAPESAVVVTAGANMGFLNAVLAVVDAGDEVILPAPYYFNHEMAVRIAGGRPVPVPTDAAYGLDPDAVAAAVTPRTRAVVTVSPNNPTGAVYEAAALRAVNDLCRAHGLLHISDEAYEYFLYDGATHVSPGAFDGAAGHTLSLFSLSKAYGFAGWRIGYMVVPAALLPAVKKIQDTNLICPPVASQHAALGALEAGRAYTDAFVADLSAVRTRTQQALAGLGSRVVVPPARGAFYFFLRVDTPLEPMALVRRLIERHRVAVIPGTTFGAADGCTLRLSYGALQPATAAEAVGRLVEGIAAEGGKG